MKELCRLAEARIGADSDIRLTEVHHTKKKDAPSGTAITIAEDIIEAFDDDDCDCGCDCDNDSFDCDANDCGCDD